jgi:hypothetical protein
MVLQTVVVMNMFSSLVPRNRMLTYLCLERPRTNHRNLSGGQRQRVALARAVYANQDIYLLDDVMSACDAHVAQHILQHCVLGLLADKCVVLVTHSVAVLPHMDIVYVMEDGTVRATGTLNELQRIGFDLTHVTNTPAATTANATVATPVSVDDGAIRTSTVAATAATSPVSSPTVALAGEVAVTAAPGRLTTTEVAKEGAVTWEVYATYIQASGGWAYVAAMLICLLLVIACSLSTTFWLAHWSGYAFLNDTQVNMRAVVQLARVSFRLATVTRLATVNHLSAGVLIFCGVLCGGSMWFHDVFLISQAQQCLPTNQLIVGHLRRLGTLFARVFSVELGSSAVVVDPRRRGVAQLDFGGAVALANVVF